MCRFTHNDVDYHVSYDGSLWYWDCGQRIVPFDEAVKILKEIPEPTRSAILNLLFERCASYRPGGIDERLQAEWFRPRPDQRKARR